MLLQKIVDPRLIFPDLPGGGVEECLAELARRLAEAGVVADAEELARRLREREKQGCTGMGNGIAIPHVKLSGLPEAVVAVGVSRDGVDFHAPDGRPAHLIFLVLAPADSPAGHLQVLARIARLLRAPGTAEALLSASAAGEIAAALRDAEDKLEAA